MVLGGIWGDVRLATVQRWLMEYMVSGGGVSSAMVVGMDDVMTFVDGELLCVGCFSYFDDVDLIIAG